jgi:hypothetical protein
MKCLRTGTRTGELNHILDDGSERTHCGKEPWGVQVVIEDLSDIGCLKCRNSLTPTLGPALTPDPTMRLIYPRLPYEPAMEK